MSPDSTRTFAVKLIPLSLCVLYVLFLWGPPRSLPILQGPAASGPDASASTEQVALLLTLKAFIAGCLAPGLLLVMLRRPLRDAGIALPDPGGWAAGAVSLVFLVPLGVWMASNTPAPWGSPLYEVLELTSMLPEHFLVFGVTIGLVQPLGRQQRPPAAARPRTGMAASTGVDAMGMWAAAVSGVLFGLIHVGKAAPLEVILSFPVGLVFAFLTLFSASIWPALFAHWLLNVIPMALDSFLAL